MIRSPEIPPIEADEPDAAWRRLWLLIACVAFWVAVAGVVVMWSR